MKVIAKDGWMATGFKPGAMAALAMVLRAEGQWYVRKEGDAYGIRNAEGGRDNSGAVYIKHVDGDTDYPYHAPGAKMAQLIGKIGKDGASFAVGKFRKFRKNDYSKVGASEELYLRINYPDSWMEPVHGHLNVTLENSDDKDPFAVEEYFDRVAGRYVRVN
jgi:hypothetical protein